MSQSHRAAPILVVDDSKTNLKVVTGLLHVAGFEKVDALSDPREVVARCRAFRPEVLILDYEMPHLNGFEVLDHLRAARLDLDPAVIMLTGRAERELRLAALRRGVRDFVTKPCDEAELAARVENAAEMQALQRLLRQQNAALESAVAARTQKLTEAMDLLRQAERRLVDQLAATREESRGKSEFMANAAHEFRTPLNAIIGFADLLKSEAYGPMGDTRYVEFADDIHQAAHHLLALVDGTLDLAKAEAGEQELELRTVDVSRVVQDSARMLRHMAEGSGVRLRVNAPDEPLPLRTDPEKIRQIVLNLASNAIKFTPKGGQVTVEVGPSPEGGAFILVIRDTGIGMANQDIATAMKPFGQVRQPDRPHPKGTGLGLPLTRRFVEMLGGSLDIVSQPGRGTVVTVRLPADPTAAHQKPRRTAAVAE